MTPLHWAVEAHSPVICKLLMEQGAQIDIRNKVIFFLRILIFMEFQSFGGHSVFDKTKNYSMLECSFVLYS